MPFPNRNGGSGSSNGSSSSSISAGINSQVMMVCLGCLILVTVVVDTYLLPSLVGRHTELRGDAFMSAILNHHRRPSSHIGTGQKGYAEVDASLFTKRRFKFQDPNADLPKLVPINNNKQVISDINDHDNINQELLGKEPILEVFREAGIPLEDSRVDDLPTWEQIVKIVGPHPVVGGLDTCQAYRDTVPAVERMLGAAGMFNTGTNLVTHLLKRNCVIPERFAKNGPEASKEAYGMRWQVPWGKHSPAKYKEEHATEKARAINKDWIMPMVTIRHPYSWMNSMCKNGYTSRWEHGRKGHNCPNLKPDGHWNNVTTTFADKRKEYSESLAHLWNDWYRYYLVDAKYPRLVIRLEDLVFHTKETTKIICHCVGGEMHPDPFSYVLDSAKADSPGHDATTGFVEAWIKYSKDIPKNGGFRKDDYEAAKEALDMKFMEDYHYKHPEAGDDERNER